MRLRLPLLAALGLLAAPPARACSVYWQPFGAMIRELGGRDLWAVRADAQVSFALYTESNLRGTLALSNIRCIHRPRGTTCPTSLNIEFQDHVDGGSCTSTMRRGRPGGPYPKLRNFLLHRLDDGRWRVGDAFQSYWGG